MREKQGLTLFQIGVGLAILGVVIHVLFRLTWLIYPLANVALLIGVILIIAGLVLPGKR